MIVETTVRPDETVQGIGHGLSYTASIPSKRTCMHSLRIQKKYQDLILSGKKKIEVRVAYPQLKSLGPSGFLNLNGQHVVRITDVRRYPDFEAMLSHEDPSEIGPGMSKEELIATLRKIYPLEKEKLGVLAICVEPVRPKD
jgi:ASC-1-like (ASCH) protein